MERGDGAGGGGGGMGPRGASAAMLGMGIQQFVSPPHAAAPVFQQPEHLHGGVFGQHHQPVPAPPSYSPYPAVPVRAGGHHEEEVTGHGAGNDGVAAQQQQQHPGGLWSRMKWTDAMVRLLIMVVYNAGDDGEGVAAAGGGGRAAAASHGHGHAHGSAAAAHAQQKKGKWKSVSRTMGEHGFTVSPQQCEDKFNDLNKRYKRVVDLLGRGKACAVVESPALLDAMDELTPRAKEEARKLLSSKHLFFREMCNYHNSSHAPAAAVTVASHHGTEGAACFHHPQPAGASSANAFQVVAQLAPSPAMVNSSTRTEGDEDDDDSENAHPPTSNDVEGMDEDVLDDEEEQAPGIKTKHRSSNGFPKRRRGESSTMAAADDEEEEEDGNNNNSNKEGEAPSSAGLQQLQSELAAAGAGGDPEQARRWMRRRALAVEEQLLACDCREYKLHRQRLKWERFCAAKERDMELAKLRNERARIDGRRMLLMIQHKEMDLLRGSAAAAAEANNSSSVDHHPRQTQTPLAAFQQQLGSSPSTAGGHHG